MAKVITTAGLLLYRMKGGRPEVFLVHNGGPYYAKKEDQAWSIPKGGVNDGEDIFEAAKREYKEETSFDVPDTKFIPLEPLKASYKIVYVWAFEGDCDPSKLKSNMCMVEWPPRSGKQIEIPEVDRGEFFDLETARTKIFKYLVPIIDMFEKKL
jgi:predicted NUDIX family NTP pyrophosphohydrolase